MTRAYTFRLPEDLIEKVDEARGDVNRTRFVQRALESALGSHPSEFSRIQGDSSAEAKKTNPVSPGGRPSIAETWRR